MILVPKKFHRIWIGPMDMPQDYVQYGRELLELHPDWTLTEWGEQNIEPTQIGDRWWGRPLPTLRNQQHYQSLVDHPNPSGVQNMPGWQETAVQQADIASYELVWRFGGVYLNCDIKPVKNFEPILDGVSAAAVYETDYWVCNCLLVGTPNNEFWNAVIEELPHRIDRMPGGFLQEQTGPHLLTDIHHKRPGELVVYPIESFNPIDGGTVEWGSNGVDLFNINEFPNSYGVHGWGHRMAGYW